MPKLRTLHKGVKTKELESSYDLNWSNSIRLKFRLVFSKEKSRRQTFGFVVGRRELNPRCISHKS